MNVNTLVEAISKPLGASDFNLTQQALAVQLQSFAELVNNLVRQSSGRAI
jgi:hypothetical protein